MMRFSSPGFLTGTLFVVVSVLFMLDQVIC